ncbi:MAG: patatin-like phospholipase family protein [Fusobacteriaceae bacterium]
MHLKKFIAVFNIIFILLCSTSFSNDITNNLTVAASTNINSTNEDQEIASIENNILLLQKKLELLKERKKEKKLYKKPKIGLVLSGGGAKGFAHIGILRELEKNNIKVDYITGTSMGAVIGALYSVGYTPDEIEKIAETIDFNSIFSEVQVDRRNLPLERKIGNKQNMFTLKYDNNLHFYLPKSLNNSNNIYFIFKKIFWNYEGVKDFNKFPIPLRVIATDINTGAAKAFDHGDLSRVLSASIAIPTIFSPVKIDNSEYIDGMMARNFPVQDALSMGADIVIGSDVGIILRDENKEFDIMSTFTQILALASAKSSSTQRGLATIVISPKVEDISATDFSNINKIVVRGEEATASSIDKIKTIIKNKNNELNLNFEKSKNNKIVQSTIQDSKTSNDIVSSTNISQDTELDKEINNSIQQQPKIIFSEINFKNDDINVKNKDTILDIFKKYKGKPLEKKELDSILKNVQGLDSVDKIYYEFDEKNESILIDVIESPSNSVGLNANYRSDYGTTFKVNTDVLVNGKVGSVSNLSGKFGDYYGVAINNFSYYGTEDKVGFFSSLSFNQSPLYIYHNNDKLAKYISNDIELLLGLSSQINNKFSLSYGVAFNRTDLKLDTGEEDYQYNDFNENYGNTFFTLSYDTLDNTYVPTTGTKGDLIYTWGGTVANEKNINYYGPIYSTETYEKVNKKLSIFAGMAGGSISGDSILETKYMKIGGIKNNLKRNELSFAGYHYQNILVKDAFIGSLGFNYNIVSNLYFIAKYNIGTFNAVSDSLYNDDFVLWKTYIQGAEAGFAYTSFIFPMSLTISKNNSESNEVLLQFNIGYFID